MLLTTQLFTLKYAIRNPLLIISPPIFKEAEVSLPRNSVWHYLDMSSGVHFPTRDMYQFSSVPKNKKIPLHHVGDLTVKEGVSGLENKKAPAEVRKWFLANNKFFRATNLLESPSTDANVVPMFNYNQLKDLYRYTQSPLSKLYRQVNLSTTVWTTVKEALSKDQDSTHFISFILPNSIPKAPIIDLVLKFNMVKFARVISDYNLGRLIELYRWIDPDLRQESTMRHITDEDSKRLTIEFKYKGYSCYLPLGVLCSLSEKSQLPSSVKYPRIKIARLFILMLHRIQDKVNAELESLEVESKTGEQSYDKQAQDNEPDSTLDDDNLDHEGPHHEEQAKDLTALNIQGLSRDKIASIAAKAEDGLNDSDIEAKLDEMLAEDNDSELDTIFEEVISKVEAEEESTTEQSLTVDYSDEHINKLLAPPNRDASVEQYLTEGKNLKLLTATEIRTVRKLNEARITLKSPHNPDKNIDEVIQESPKDIQLTEDNIKLNIGSIAISDVYKKDPIKAFDDMYVEKMLQADILACVANLEKSEIIIKGYEVDRIQDSVGAYDIHKVTIKPLKGKESKLYSRIPVIKDDGSFMSAGIKFRMRKTKTALPIVKISPIRVALNSNYSKIFISRTERKSNDPNFYIVNTIKERYIDGSGNAVKLIPTKKHTNKYDYPYMYTLLAGEFNLLQTDKYTFVFNPAEMANQVDEATLAKLNQAGLTYCGYTESKQILGINKDNLFVNFSTGQPIGTVVDVFNIDKEKLPKAFTTIKVLGDDIPLGVAMSYYLGLGGLLSVTKTKYQILEAGKRYTPTDNELVLRFNDAKVVITTNTIDKELLFNGFLYYKNFTKDYTLKEFDYKEVYLNILETRESGLIHLKELRTLNELFLDPITVDVLESMKEPTEFIPLLLRANSLLVDLKHPDINDPMCSRIRGHDRIPGLMYRALAESVREFKVKGRSSSKIELDPYKVWNYITQDNTVKIVEEINPILNSKENEAVTLSGMDGLDKSATPKTLRRFHKNDTGLISEATVDSSDVALNVFLSPYAKIDTVRGLVREGITEYEETPGKVFSTSTLLAPMSELDDPKRLNYIQIQNGHTIAADGYHQPIVRTGYEYAMAYKVSELYAVMAKEDCQVTNKTDKLITVKYQSGQVKTYKIGTQYGRMEGGVYPHAVMSPHPVGKKLKAGDYISYNTGFFELDWLDPTKLIMKMGMTVTTALSMTSDVYEDGSAISTEISTKMSTDVIKEKVFIIGFDKEIVNLKLEGTELQPTDVLFSLVENTTGDNNLSEAAIEMLQNLAMLSPKSKYKAVLERYEVKYNGDTADMSSSLRKLVNRLDKQLHEETAGTDFEAKTNLTNSEYRSSGKNLLIDTLELKVFLRVKIKQSVGDKGVFGNQAKSVISTVFTDKITTESGTPIHAKFSFKGLINRVLLSPIAIGTTTRLAIHASKQLADIYFKK